MKRGAKLVQGRAKGAPWWAVLSVSERTGAVEMAARRPGECRRLIFATLELGRFHAAHVNRGGRRVQGHIRQHGAPLFENAGGCIKIFAPATEFRRETSDEVILVRSLPPLRFAPALYREP